MNSKNNFSNRLDSTSGSGNMRRNDVKNCFKCKYLNNCSSYQCAVCGCKYRIKFCTVRMRHLFRKYFRYARITSLRYSKFNFSAAISNIYAQFAPVNRGLYSAYIMPNNFFQKYFRYARMTSLKFSKFNFSAAISNIYAQFVPVNRGLNSAYFMCKQLFRKYFRYAQMASLKFSKFNFSAAISNISAQLASVNRRLNSAYFMPHKLVRKYFRGA